VTRPRRCATTLLEAVIRNKLVTSSRYLNRATPGVYVTEIEAFGSSIVGVATSVPIFIGYTEFAGDPQTGTALYNRPVRLSSLAEFQNYFGTAAPPLTFAVAPPSTRPTPGNPPEPTGGARVPFASFEANAAASAAPFAVASAPFEVNLATPGASFFSLYHQMQLFFANGGNEKDVQPGLDFFKQLNDSGNLNPTGLDIGKVQKGEVALGIGWDYLGLGWRDQLVGQVNLDVLIPEDGILNSSERPGRTGRPRWRSAQGRVDTPQQLPGAAPSSPRPRVEGAHRDERAGQRAGRPTAAPGSTPNAARAPVCSRPHYPRAAPLVLPRFYEVDVTGAHTAAPRQVHAQTAGAPTRSGHYRR